MLDPEEYAACYVGPGQAEGIFNATDRNKDGFMTEDEYVENRSITDQCKSIFCDMNVISNTNEFGCLPGVPYRGGPLNAEANTENALSIGEFDDGTDLGECLCSVFKMFDRNEIHGIWQLEWLRVWGHWAREDATLNIEKVKVSWNDSNIMATVNFIPLEEELWTDNPFGILIVILAGEKVVEQRVELEIRGNNLVYYDEGNLNGNISAFKVRDFEDAVADVKLKIAFDPELFPEGAGSSPAKLEFVVRVGDDTDLATGSDLIGLDKAWTKKKNNRWFYRR
jgi:hypothetical protein